MYVSSDVVHWLKMKRCIWLCTEIEQNLYTQFKNVLSQQETSKAIVEMTLPFSDNMLQCIRWLVMSQSAHITRVTLRDRLLQLPYKHLATVHNGSDLCQVIISGIHHLIIVYPSNIYTH